jgi:ATP-dependent RNA helicase DeaD
VSDETSNTPADVSFESLGLDPLILKAISEAGYTSPMPVQSACLPAAMEGRDMVVQSRTGSGKTAAFALPILHRIRYDDIRPQVLVLAPTRELALQVHGEFERLGKYVGLRSVCIYGGTRFGEQIDRLLAGVHVVVGTPGRVLDHYRRGNFHMNAVEALILDEADEMLSAGFFEDIRKVFEALTSLRQVLLFSATLPLNLERLIIRRMRTPFRVDLSGDTVQVDRIENIAYTIEPAVSRVRSLVGVIEAEDPTAAIIFCNTKSSTEAVTKYLRRRGYDAAMLNSDLCQTNREEVMNRIKEGRLRLLVATDIAARGIDISLLPCVIHYDLPDDTQQYIHRTGRTGRVDRSGRAISLVSARDYHALKRLESAYGIKPVQAEVPSREETVKMMADRRIREIKEKLEASPVIPEEFQSIAREILSDPDAAGLIAMLVDYYVTAPLQAEDAAAARVDKRSRSAGAWDDKGPDRGPPPPARGNRPPPRGGPNRRGGGGGRPGSSRS